MQVALKSGPGRARLPRSLAAALLITAACEPAPSPTPGYSGRVPGAGQAVVRDLYGKTIADAAGELGGGSWTVGAFLVGPSGPFVTLHQGTSSRTIRLFTDGDVSDLYRRAAGTAHPTLAGTLSDGYRKSWRPRGARLGVGRL